MFIEMGCFPLLARLPIGLPCSAFLLRHFEWLDLVHQGQDAGDLFGILGLVFVLRFHPIHRQDLDLGSVRKFGRPRQNHLTVLDEALDGLDSAHQHACRSGPG